MGHCHSVVDGCAPRRLPESTDAQRLGRVDQQVICLIALLQVFPVRRIRIVNSDVPAGDTQRVFAAVSIGIGPIVLADTKDEVSDGDRDGGGNERAATAPAATLGVLVGRGVSLAASAPPAAASD